MGRDLRALVPARGLNDLNDDLVPRLPIVRLRARPSHGTVIFGIIGIGIGKGEVAVALQAAGDERRLHAAQNVHDPAFIDVARDLPARLFFGGELRELPVLQERDELLSAISIEKPFLLHLAS